MTDNEIISGLEHCINRDNPSRCGECEHVTGCKSFLLREALDLINRQKAEIENLRTQLLIRNSVEARKIKIPEGEPYGHNDPVGEKGTMGEVGIGQKWGENDDR